jgi:hypothetical protein
MDLKEAGQKWEELHQNWVFANQEARRMELKNMVHYKACVEGKGPAPSAADLELADKLRHVANEAQAECDEFIRRVFR